MGKLHSLACVDFLVEGSGACVLMDEAGSCLLVGRTTSGGVFWGVCELIIILGSLSANGCVYVPLLLVLCHGVSSTVACWSLSDIGP